MNLHQYGHQLVEDYNAKHGTDYSPRSFFWEVAGPLLYGVDHDLIVASNSPFQQQGGWVSQRDSEEDVQQAFETLDTAIKEGERDYSKMPGGPANSERSTTSGQVSFGAHPALSEEDAYAAWLGYACGLQVKGGFLVYDREACLPVFDGWKHYRNYLQATPDFKQRQLSRWNAFYLQDPSPNPQPLSARLKSNSKQLPSPSSAHVILALAMLSNQPRMLFASQFGQTETTVGYLAFRPEEIRTLNHVFESIVDSHQATYTFRDALKTDLSFYQVCDLGHIGLEAMRPKNLFKDTTDLEQSLFRITWLQLMLDQENLPETAQTTAQQLQEFTSNVEQKGTTRRSRLVDDLFKARTHEDFVAGLNGIVEEDGDYDFREVANASIRVSDKQLRLFIQLLKLHYQSL